MSRRIKTKKKSSKLCESPTVAEWKSRTEQSIPYPTYISTSSELICHETRISILSPLDVMCICVCDGS